MRKVVLTIVVAMMAIVAVDAQFKISTDLVSRYVWRGTQFSASPAIQPGLSYSAGGFTAGAWGSYAFDNVGSECDLYASYAFDFGLGIVVTDYFFPADPASEMFGGYFNYDDLHTFEAGLTFAKNGLSVGVYKYLNQLEDLYIEAAYAFNDNVSLTVGAGDQLYTNNTELNVCNVALKYVKEVSLTDHFKVKPFASFIVNPNREQSFLVVGITL